MYKLIVSVVAVFIIAGNVLATASRITAGDLSIVLDSTGVITELLEPGGRNHNVLTRPTTLISLIVEASPSSVASSGASAHKKPTGWRYVTGIAAAGGIARGEYTFIFDGGIRVEVESVEKTGYATLEIKRIINPNKKDIRHVLWGPLTLDITAHVGDTVGVVSDRDFAIGMFGTNAKTLGGWPKQYLESVVIDRNMNRRQQSAFRHYFQVSAALPTEFGSILQAYTRDYTVERVFDPWEAQEEKSLLPVPALTDDLASAGQLVGSKVVVFGLSRTRMASGNDSLRDAMRAEVLDRIATIEVGEAMPHPFIGGVWGKKSERASTPYLILTDLTSNNLDTGLNWANDIGWKSIYRDTCWGVLANGNPGGGNDLGGINTELADEIETASNKHVGLGFYSHFGVLPDSAASKHLPGLNVVHYGRLQSAINPTATSLTVKPFPGASGADLQAGIEENSGYLRIESEMLGYTGRSISGDNLVLSGLDRGADGTMADSHAADVRVDLLDRVSYCGGAYIAGLVLSYNTLARSLADKLDLGLSNFSNDGSEWLTRSGYGVLGLNLVMDKVYDEHMNKEDFVYSASYGSPFLWHIHSHYNWGEESAQPMQRNRWGNQVYFQRNYMPQMLGKWDINDANE